MKLAFCLGTLLFHSVHKDDSGIYKANCQDVGDFSDCCIYPPSHSRIPIKDNVCKICFQENKEEIVYLLTKIKLGIALI